MRERARVAMWPLVAALLSPVLAAQADQLARPSERRARGFLDSCLEFRREEGPFFCHQTKCNKQYGGQLDVSQLQGLTCSSSADCSPDVSGLGCSRGNCICPPFSAFNLTTCRCEMTGRCSRDEPGCHLHNGKQCRDQFCSCHPNNHFRDLLVDPATLFCVLPGSGLPSGHSGAEYIVLWVVIALALPILITVAAYSLYLYGIFQKGDYTCENPDTVDLPEVHNATWDYPSMDYINRHDEEIVFTLAQAKDFVGASNASTIHVIDEQTSFDHNFLSENHENQAYVVEDVDDPRND